MAIPSICGFSESYQVARARKAQGHCGNDLGFSGGEVIAEVNDTWRQACQNRACDICVILANRASCCGAFLRLQVGGGTKLAP